MKKIYRAIAYVLALGALLMLGGAPNASAQNSQNRAGLVVQSGDGSVQSFCIAFSGDTITGFDLLLKSGLDVKAETYGGMGGLVCKIGAVGCDYPGEVCACKSFGPEGIFWGYYHLRNGVWKSSSLGSSGYKVHGGEVDGWAWSGGKPPAVRTFDQICGVAAPQPTSTPRAITPTSPPPTPQPTFTARPPTPKPPIATPVFNPPKPNPTKRVQTANPTQVVAVPHAVNTEQPSRPSPIKLSPTETLVTQAVPTHQTPHNTPRPTARILATATEKRAITAVVKPVESTAQATPTIGIIPTGTRTDTPATPSPAVVLPTNTGTEAPTLISTSTVTATATTTATPTPDNTRVVALPVGGTQIPSRTETAQTFSIVIVTAVAVGLLMWGGITLAARRTPGKKRDGSRVE